MKSTFLMPAIMLIAAPTLAQCLPEEGRFSKETIEYQGTSLWVVNDNRTQLQWMMCPLGQQGEQCLGAATQRKREELDKIITVFNGDKQPETSWRLPYTQELLTITDQGCRYGTYTEFFKLTQPIESLEQLYQTVAPYKEKFDIFYQQHQANLLALDHKRRSDAVLDKKVEEWLENSSKLSNGQWSRETSNLVHNVLVPWLEENSPEWVAVRTSRNKFSNAYDFGDESIGLEKLRAHYESYYEVLNQSFATQAGYSVSFKNVPNLGTGTDNHFEVFYTYEQSTIQSQGSWLEFYVRLVRPIPSRSI
ncbi:hypothetical protein BOO25_01570 [Vibrio navarrensis]|uniref:Lcl domain-containing protein n=1 Tax=Vibrio navarrensis TaxID=29495 RepID=UPI00192F964C|nr:DUF1566 domain-containing protein [Vibrio navarrensis]MBE3667632.1 hypothetical protein [Vibrio navarrensis]